MNPRLHRTKKSFSRIKNLPHSDYDYAKIVYILPCCCCLPTGFQTMDPANEPKGRKPGTNTNKATNRDSLACIVFLRYDDTISETNTELQENQQNRSKQRFISFKYSNSNNQILQGSLKSKGNYLSETVLEKFSIKW